MTLQQTNLGMTSLEEDLRSFFERYARTFHEDVGLFCDLYEFPATTIRLDGTVQHFQAKHDAMQFFAVAKERYEAEGCRRWEIRTCAVERREPEGALVTIDWEMID